ncbi:MAG: Verru_Chthon cassette protein B [Chthoniobacter sp.]|nr:Verru_Chthon cassette protein B [Chthoniobacter sp.]
MIVSPHSAERSLPSHSSSWRVRGFSLIEVVLCIGIVAFAFLAIFGMLPVGLSTFRQAMDNTVGSQIVQRLVGEAQQTDFPTLIATSVTLRYFDDQGNEVTVSKDYIYTAEITVLAPTTLPNTSTPPTASLATVTIRLANNPGHNPTPFASASTVRFTTHTALIAKNQ